MKTSLKVSVCNFCGCSNSNSFITPGQRGERLENLPCLGLYFQTTHIFLTGFLLWAHWYKCWRSIQICFLLVTHGQNPKRAAIPKAKDSTAHGYLTGYDWPKCTSGTALFRESYCIATTASVWV